MSDYVFPLGAQNEFITLDKLLKVTRHDGSGGEARNVIQEGMVEVNGEVELQKRKKMRKGDVAAFNGETITLQ